MKKLLTICFILIHTWSLASNNDQAPWYIVQISDPQLGFIEKNKSIEQAGSEPAESAAEQQAAESAGEQGPEQAQ